MKKFIILLMSITCLLFASCTCKSKDERAADVGIADEILSNTIDKYKEQ